MSVINGGGGGGGDDDDDDDDNNNHVGKCARTLGSSNVKVQNVYLDK